MINDEKSLHWEGQEILKEEKTKQPLLGDLGSFSRDQDAHECRQGMADRVCWNNSTIFVKFLRNSFQMISQFDRDGSGV